MKAATRSTKKSAAPRLLKAPAEHPYAIGASYFIRTVTHYWTGRLVEIYPHELVLEDAAWIADTARFSDAIRTGALNEVEPMPDGARVFLARGAIVDVIPWPHPLPRVQK